MGTTARQKLLFESLELPYMKVYPLPPNCSSSDGEDVERGKLLELYRQFAMELYTGMYLTQMTSNHEYANIHCQLMEDMMTLKMDQDNGCIIEFPLTAVLRVYRFNAYEPNISEQGEDFMEHIVVVEFMRRKLLFVFGEHQVSQRFLACLELLIRRAQQQQEKNGAQSLTPIVTVPVKTSKLSI